jgi:hypothetical protein
MSGAQRLVPWLTLALLTVVGAGGAALGIMASNAPVALDTAATSTLHAANYTELATVTGGEDGNETLSLVWHAPDTLGGHVESQGRRAYVWVFGTTEYQSTTVAVTRGPSGLTIQKGTGQPASASDPAQGLLPYAQRATHVTRSGDTYSFEVTQDGQTAHFTATVTGPYVSRITVSAPSQSSVLGISQVGTSPPVKLPAGAKIVAAAPSSAAG